MMVLLFPSLAGIAIVNKQNFRHLHFLLRERESCMSTPQKKTSSCHQKSFPGLSVTKVGPMISRFMSVCNLEDDLPKME